MKRRRKLCRKRSLNENASIQTSLESTAESAIRCADNGGIAYVVPQNFKKDMATIATSAWKARSRMVDTATGEIRGEMKRVCCDIERIQRCLNDLGIVVEDHTNMPFDYGLPWNVIATKRMPGIAKEIVTETLKPTVRWNEQIIQHAEVEIGTPTDHEENV